MDTAKTGSPKLPKTGLLERAVGRSRAPVLLAEAHISFTVGLVFHKDGLFRTERHRLSPIIHPVQENLRKELFESVLPIGRSRIGVVALTLFIPYQHRFCGVVTPDAAEFRRVLQGWDETG